ncbi:MAG: DUF5678 domain-containing protein [Acidobacteriia bacterium]|nr:DUF5678 domain-containing protein [Terriglobia bacterium]
MKFESLGRFQNLQVSPGVFMSQRPIPEEQQREGAFFPKSDNVVINRDGAFVPCAMFGENPDLSFRIQAGPRGKEVVVFSQAIAGHQTLPRAIEPFEAEQHWLRTHHAAYAGRWVALSGDRLLADGVSAAEVYRTARAVGVAVPFVEFIETDDPAPFAGW